MTTLGQSYSTGSTRSTSSSSSAYSPLRDVRRLKWGIFEVAYERPATPRGSPQWMWKSLLAVLGLTVPPHSTPMHAPQSGQDSGDEEVDWESGIGSTLRLLKLVFSFSPGSCIRYLSCVAWIAASPAVALYLAFLTLSLLAHAMEETGFPLNQESREELSLYLCMWLGCSFVSSWVSVQQEESKSMLEGHLRRHFLPLLVDETLKVSNTPSPEIEPDLNAMPNPWSFGELVPAWDIISNLTVRLRDILALFAQALAVLLIVRSLPPSDALVFATLAGLVVAVAILAPSNGVGGVGYTFWTENTHYHRLLALYNIVFDSKYREAIVKDDLASYLSTEYHKTSEELGSVKSNLLTLACSLPPPWYWSQAQMLVADYPMGLYMFFNIRSLSPNSLVAIAVFQYGINSLTKAVDAFRNGQYSSSLAEMIGNAERFMHSIAQDAIRQDQHDVAQQRPLVYPVAGTAKGMHIHLKDVSLRYPEQAHDALNGVSLTIKPGEFILLVGSNGSGKSSLLKVITGTTPANSTIAGRIKINRHLLPKYSSSSIRRTIAYVSQSELIYPLSMRENISIGLGNDTKNIPAHELSAMVEEAAAGAQCDSLLRRHGDGSVLQRCRVVGQSLRGCGNGDVGRGAYRELKRHDPSYRDIAVTPGEKQRLILARCLLKLKRRHCDLIVLDEGTSALDPITESKVFESLNQRRSGKTMILVTHRIGTFAQQADRIICMEDGRVVQNGTHDQLMKDSAHPQYRELFTAQTTSFG